MVLFAQHLAPGVNMNYALDNSEIIQCDECESNMLCTGIEEMHTAPPAGE